MSFIDDIQSRDTAIYPVVIFDTSATQTEDIHISTKSVVISSGDSQRTFAPLLLSSPSIKESIDFENRKYKISTVNLKISNTLYNGERFSDRISSYDVFGDGIIRGALNTHCLIFWISPSVESANINIPDPDGSNEAYLAYHGSVRAITHDEKTCSITLEDISQATLHRDVPVNILGNTSDIPERFQNKPFPMVYGTVDKSPLVISTIHPATKKATIKGDFKDVTLSGEDNPLMIFKDDSYINVQEDSPNAIGRWFYSSSAQYTKDEGTGTITTVSPVSEGEEIGGDFDPEEEDTRHTRHYNTLGDNAVEVEFYNYPSPELYTPINDYSIYGVDPPETYPYFYDSNSLGDLDIHYKYRYPDFNQVLSNSIRKYWNETEHYEWFEERFRIDFPLKDCPNALHDDFHTRVYWNQKLYYNSAITTWSDDQDATGGLGGEYWLHADVYQNDRNYYPVFNPNSYDYTDTGADPEIFAFTQDGAHFIESGARVENRGWGYYGEPFIGNWHIMVSINPYLKGTGQSYGSEEVGRYHNVQVGAAFYQEQSNNPGSQYYFYGKIRYLFKGFFQQNYFAHIQGRT